MKTKVVTVVFFALALQLFAQGQVIMVESDRITAPDSGVPVLPLFPNSPVSSPLSGPPSILPLDNSPSFVVQAAPEPSTYVLTGVAFLLLGAYRFCNRNTVGS
jgi:hypothetical protein